MADLVLTAPLAGWVLPLDEVDDAVFAGRMLGDGVAIDPVGGMLHAPCDAVVTTIHAAGHAITLRTAAGAEILIHIGMDTVTLGGDGFDPQVVEGQQVRRGDPLITLDLDRLAGSMRSLATPIIVTNGDRFAIATRVQDRATGVGDGLMTLVALDAATADAAPAGVQHSRSIVVPLAHGIHARPAARIGAAAKPFDAAVALVRGDKRADVRSAVGLLALGIQHGDEVTIEANGLDAAAAIDAVASLIESGMGEPAPAIARPVPPAPATPLPAGMLRGITASPGLAIGPAQRLRTAEIAIDERADDPARETAALVAAIAAVRASLTARAAASGTAAGAIMTAHLAFLDDPALHDTAVRDIAGGASAAQGWRTALRAQAATLLASGNARLAERADDLRDLENQVLHALAGTADDGPAFPAGAILIADDLLPSELVALADRGVAGLCIARGGPTSHVAILAAGMGIPALVAMGDALGDVADGTIVIVHAGAGRATIAPDHDAVAVVEAQLAVRAGRKSAAQAAARDECRTRDGIRIEAFANLGSVADARIAVANGAEGCGLLRTEFLFLDRAVAPDADEQAIQYQRIADELRGRPLIVRLLDIGGDKPASYLPIAAEENPALGVRGIRVGLANPAMLDAQLRGILAVRPLGQCRIMVPMIATLDEVRQVRAALDRVRAAHGIDDPVSLGIMVETPAAAMTADLLAAEVDFLSIGTNDLTQYTLAMDRGNAGVAGAVDGLEPAVLRLIARTCEGGAAHGRWTGVCGGLASDPLAVPILLGLGVTELSATPTLLPEIKALVRGLSLDDCRRHARDALALPGAAAVRALAIAFAGAQP